MKASSWVATRLHQRAVLNRCPEARMQRGRQKNPALSLMVLVAACSVGFAPNWVWGWDTTAGAGTASSVAVDVAGNVILAGGSRTSGFTNDFTVVKLAGGDGQELWRTDLDGAAGQVALTMSVLLGSDPTTDDCVTARRVPCTSKVTSVSCKN